jgi:hypothetical protein
VRGPDPAPPQPHPDEGTVVFIAPAGEAGNLDKVVREPLGTRGSFDIWLHTSEPLSRVSLDLQLVGDAVQFSDVVIHNPESSGGPRWTEVADPIVEPRAINTINAYASIGSEAAGIGPLTTADDSAFDVRLDAFKFATVHYEIVGIGAVGFVMNIGQERFSETAAPIILSRGGDQVSNEPGTFDSRNVGRLFVSPKAVPEASSVVVLCIALGSMFPLRLRITKKSETQHFRNLVEEPVDEYLRTMKQ